MTDQQKKAVEEAAKAIASRPIGRGIFTKGAEEVINHPEKYGLGTWPVLAEKLEILTEENTRLREALYVAHASLCTYGKHPIIDEQVSKALKGGNTCKP